jgi:hypothetical protein
MDAQAPGVVNPARHGAASGSVPNVVDARGIDWAQARSTFNALGYIQISGLVPEEHLANIEKAYLALLKKYDRQAFGSFDSAGMIEDQRFHDAALRFKQEKPRLSGAVYDAMQCALPVVQLSACAELTDAVAALAGVSPVEISNFNHGVLMAVPHDQRNFISWHQDTFNDEAYHDYRAGITAWLPMHYTGVREGGLIVCPGSHVERVERVANERGSDNASLSYGLPRDYLERYPQLQVEAGRGDAVLISMNIAHSAGVNDSTRIRYTVQNRYYPVTDDNFVAGKPIYKSSVMR